MASNTFAPSADAVLSLDAFPAAFVAAHSAARLADTEIRSHNRLVVTLVTAFAFAVRAEITHLDNAFEVAVHATDASAPATKAVSGNADLAASAKGAALAAA